MKWVNSHLARVGCRINDLYIDLRDGKMLMKLLEVLSGERLVSTCTIRAVSCENLLFVYAKTKAQIRCAVTVQLICTFVFATEILQSLYFLNPNFKPLAIFVVVQPDLCWFWWENLKTDFLMAQLPYLYFKKLDTKDFAVIQERDSPRTD